MLPPGHIAAGFLAGKLSGLPEEYSWLAGLFGFFPDLDFFYAFLKVKKFISTESVNHRRFLTHAPLLYLLLFVIWNLIFPDQQLYALAFLIGSWSHFVIDSFSTEGILWLYPFSKKLYGLPLDRKIEITDQGFFSHWLRFVKEYTKVFSFKLEAVLILLALSLLIIS